MKKFITKTFIFLLIPVLILGIALTLPGYLYLNTMKNYPLSDSVETLFAGDSHIQHAINDSLLTGGINISNSAEALYYTYFKLERLLEGHPGIKRIYLGVAYHSFTNYYDEFIYGRYSLNVATRYFYTLPAEEKIKMLKQNRTKLAAFSRNLNAESFGYYVSENNEYPFIGYYENTFGGGPRRDTIIDKRVKAQYYEMDTLRGFSAINILYFDKIIELCKSSNIELVILNTPLHPYYLKKVPGKFVNHYYSLMEAMDIKLIDLGKMEMNDSLFVPDGDHVNREGAIIVTNLIRDSL